LLKYLKIYLSAFFFLFLILFLYILYHNKYINDRNIFILYNFILFIFLVKRIIELKGFQKKLFFLNPIFLSSILTFILNYGVSNVLFFMPSEEIEILSLVPEVTPYMVKLIGLALIASIAMWLGYWSPFSKMQFSFSSNIKIENFLSKYSNLHWYAVPTLLIISTISRILQVKLGVFGYSSTSYDRLVELGSYTQFLSIGASLGRGALLLYSLTFYNGNSNQKSKLILYFIILNELVWGLLSGFKSAVVIPFIIVFITYYVSNGKFLFRWLLFAIIGLSIAYTLIEPFRATRNIESDSDISSLGQIVSIFRDSRNLDLEVSTNEVSVLTAFLSRSNLTWIGSLGIEYKDNSERTIEDPDFLGNIILSPFHAFIPRFLWGDKPLANLGLWYNQVVLGMKNNSSTAMGPVTYLYFAGGVFMVIIFFYFLGILQRYIFFTLKPWQNISGAFIYLTIFSTITVIDSSINSIIISLLRDIPLTVLFIIFFFKKNKSII
jgi:hypothetical protein